MFKVGQKVYSLEYGRGHVDAILTNGALPVKVNYPLLAISVMYTKEGRSRLGCARTLFFKEIPIPPDALEPPWEPDFQPGDVVEITPKSGQSSLFRQVIQDHEDSMLLRIDGCNMPRKWEKSLHTFRKVGQV